MTAPPPLSAAHRLLNASREEMSVDDVHAVARFAVEAAGGSANERLRSSKSKLATIRCLVRGKALRKRLAVAEAYIPERDFDDYLGGFGETPTPKGYA